jgi:hypothetical protein
MKLFNYTNELGDTILFECEARLENNEMVVYFIKSEFSDANKWNEIQVLTDVYIKRCQISDMYKKKDCKRIKKYISCRFTTDLKIIDEITKMSAKVDEITISLPTSVYSHKRDLPTSVRAFKNSFLPLFVDINGEDASRAFQDFDMFGSKAVNVAFDALINGKRPNVKNDLFDFYQIGFLRNKVFGGYEENEVKI